MHRVHRAQLGTIVRKAKLPLLHVLWVIIARQEQVRADQHVRSARTATRLDWELLRTALRAMLATIVRLLVSQRLLTAVLVDTIV